MKSILVCSRIMFSNYAALNKSSSRNFERKHFLQKNILKSHYYNWLSWNSALWKYLPLHKGYYSKTATIYSAATTLLLQYLRNFNTATTTLTPKRCHATTAATILPPQHCHKILSLPQYRHYTLDTSTLLQQLSNQKLPLLLPQYCHHNTATTYCCHYTSDNTKLILQLYLINSAFTTTTTPQPSQLCHYNSTTIPLSP